MTCEKDTRMVEVIYPTVDYVEEFGPYGERVFKTLKADHSEGMKVVRVTLCEPCKLKKARPQPAEERLRTIQRAEEIPQIGDWTRSQKSLSKKLGLTGKPFDVCSKCGSMEKVRNDTTREPLCKNCYKVHRRDYMRDFMREKRGSAHVD